MPKRSFKFRERRAVTLAALFLVLLLAMIAFGVGLGYIVLVRTQLQAAADGAAMAGASQMGVSTTAVIAEAKRYAAMQMASAAPVTLRNQDVEFGNWNATNRTFTPTGELGNAVRVTAKRDGSVNGESPLFFGRIFGMNTFSCEASAVAMANPRDIAFVVDLSGSMNDDTEVAWATMEIINTFSPQGYPNVGIDLMVNLYNDLNFVAFPGVVQYIGQPLGVPQNAYAYSEMTKDTGPLASPLLAASYRIFPTDTESVRKQKAYRWIIDKQLAVIMPNARPTPNSTTNYAYWEKYLDYLLISVTIAPPPPPPPAGGGGGGGGTPPPPSLPPPPPPPSPTIGRLTPADARDGWLAAWHQGRRATRNPLVFRPDSKLAMSPGGIWESVILAQQVMSQVPGTPPINRGAIPPNQDWDRITSFNNPNRATFPAATSYMPNLLRNVVGYATYVQFMMDHGRDLRPDDSTYVSLSTSSPDCRWHTETTAGGSFSFPPREQPMHAARRSLIAAMQIVKERNATIPDAAQRDWVSIVSFDSLGGPGPVIRQTLTGNYDAAMLACTSLQALGDKGASTATEPGLIKARTHLLPASEGGAGRQGANKVVVLLTDGVPNAYQTSSGTIDQYMLDNAHDDFYGGGYYWLDAPLMEAASMKGKNWQVYPVGIGLGTDYGFMDRIARMGGTANADGQSARGSGNPAEYEQRLTDIFDQIIQNPRVRLVK